MEPAAAAKRNIPTKKLESKAKRKEEPREEEDQEAAGTGSKGGRVDNIKAEGSECCGRDAN